MGGKSQTTKETTNQVSNQTQTPVIQNALLSNGINDYLSGVGDFANTDASSLVSGPSSLQQQAFTGAQGLTTSPLYGEAAGIASGVAGAGANTAQGASLLDNLSAYQNPYQTQVTDAYSADFDANAGKTRAAQAAAAAANGGAFGGSRYAIQEAQTEGELSRARATGLAGILQGGFDRATSLSASDAALRQGNNQFNAGQQDSALNRALSSAGLLGSLAGQQGGEDRANIALQAGLGDTQRDIAQSAATSDLSKLEALKSLLGYDPSMLVGQNVSGTASGTSTSKKTEDPGLLGTIGKGASTASSLAALFSDARLKENIRLTGTRPDGLNVYRYNYLWSPEEVEGLMAHEVARVYPEAIGRIGEYLTVDYAHVQ